MIPPQTLQDTGCMADMPAGRLGEPPSPAADPAPARPAALDPRTPIGVLLVEDDPILLLDLMRTVEDAGHHVLGTATRGEAAVATFTRIVAGGTTPDLVLFDINLGRGMDGITAAQAIRALHADVAIAFRSAHGDADTRARAATVDPVAFLEKGHQSTALPRLLAALPAHPAPRG